MGERKTMRNAIINVVLLILVSSIVIFAFANAFYTVAFDSNFYKNEFSRRFPEEKADFYYSITQKILSYYQKGSNDKKIGLDAFSEREKVHLVEVKNLVQKTIFLTKISLLLIFVICFVIYFIERERFHHFMKKALLYAGYGILFIFLVGIIFFANFSNSFTKFHLLAFETDTWLLDQDDTLIIMFPEEFFMKSGIAIFLLSMAYGIALIAFANLLLPKIKKEKHK